MSEEAVSHHPAPERLKLLSNYEFKQYRDTLPAQPTPLPWAEGNNSKDGMAMTALLAHYAAAENAAAYIADAGAGLAGERAQRGDALLHRADRRSRLHAVRGV